MSTKALYQTLYQSEHLFRVPTETPADWGQAVMQPVEAVLAAPVPKVPAVREPQLPVVALIPEPIIEPVSVDLQSVIEPEPVVETVAPIEVIPEPEPVVELVVELPPVADTRPSDRTAQPQKPALLQHKVLLLADEDLSPSDILFLEKILKAVNLDINGVDLLNLYGVSDVDFASVLRHKYINHFITFGVPFRRINLDIMMDRYQPIRFDGITFLMADSLPVIEANQTLKRFLWNSLKRVFELG
ncbi:MAG: hypothetical protein EAZ91_23420 [Cytophagales bacterium]|nr:MAG: hypothetical protein EAZ91_23420 [Cytophagales bacterium]